MKRLGRLAALALVIGSLWYFDANPRVLLFAFILYTVAQVLQIKWFLHLGHSSRYRPWVEALTRRPTGKETEWARNYINLKDAATTLPMLLMMIGSLAVFAFLLAHVDQDKELAFDGSTFVGEIVFALALTGLYLAESLVLRETAMDFDESEAMNFHYGSSRITVLAFAVLFAGAGVAFLQMAGREVTPWVIMGPLVVLKHLFETSG